MKFTPDSYCHNQGRFVPDGGVEVEKHDLEDQVLKFVERELESNTPNQLLRTCLAACACTVDLQNAGKLYMAVDEESEWLFTLREIVVSFYKSNPSFAAAVNNLVIMFSSDELEEMALEALEALN